MARADSRQNQPGSSRRGGSDTFWDRQLRARIGQDLRNLFQDALSEPVPDHLNRLLTQMKTAADKDRPHPDKC